MCCVFELTTRYIDIFSSEVSPLKKFDNQSFQFSWALIGGAVPPCPRYFHPSLCPGAQAPFMGGHFETYMEKAPVRAASLPENK